MFKTRITAATLVLGALVYAGCALAAGAEKAAVKAPKRYTIEQFMATTALGGASFRPSLRILFRPSLPVSSRSRK